MDFLEGLTTWFAGFAGSEWAIVVLAVATFLESILSPIPPDPLLIPMSVLRPEMAIWYGLVATIASLSGALVGHWLGSRFGRPILSRFTSESKVDLAESLFDRYGAWALLAAAVTPIPYKLFAILAGVLKFDRKRFLIISLIGRGARFIGLGILFFLFGEQIQHFIEQNIQKLSLFGLAAVVVSCLCLWMLVKFRSKLGVS